jgi:hypothetical protein
MYKLDRKQVAMRKVFVVGLALAVVVGVPLAAMAASGGVSSSLDLQAARWTTTATTTSSSVFRAIPQLSGLRICALNQVTATLSVGLDGAPAGFQIRVDGDGVMQPGPVRFVPVGPHDSFAFTWVRGVSPFEANDHHVFDVEWRSPGGKAATLERATFNLQYQRGTHRC